MQQGSPSFQLSPEESAPVAGRSGNAYIMGKPASLGLFPPPCHPYAYLQLGRLVCGAGLDRLCRGLELLRL